MQEAAQLKKRHAQQPKGQKDARLSDANLQKQLAEKRAELITMRHSLTRAEAAKATMKKVRSKMCTLLSQIELCIDSISVKIWHRPGVRCGMGCCA